jgi:hypothetical protein
VHQEIPALNVDLGKVSVQQFKRELLEIELQN